MLLTMLLVFILCWFPFQVSILYSEYRDSLSEVNMKYTKVRIKHTELRMKHIEVKMKHINVRMEKRKIRTYHIEVRIKATCYCHMASAMAINGCFQVATGKDRKFT